MKFQIGLVLLLSFIGLSVQLGAEVSKLFRKSSIHEGYEQLNRRLERSGVENLKDGLEVAEEYLKIVEREKKSFFDKSNRNLVKAIRQFMELQVVFSNFKQCDWEDFETVQRNVDAAGEANNKVSELLAEAAAKLAEDCQKSFPENYKRIWLIISVNPEYNQAFTYVGQVMDAVSQVHFGGNVLPSIDNLKEGISVRGDKDAQAVYQVLEALAEESNDRSNPSKANPMKQSELERIYKSYVIEPCNKYVDTLGSYVFMPADLVLKRAKPSYSEDDKKIHQFLRAWAHYRLCSSLIVGDGGKQFFNQLNSFLKSNRAMKNYKQNFD